MSVRLSACAVFAAAAIALFTPAARAAEPLQVPAPPATAANLPPSRIALHREPEDGVASAAAVAAFRAMRAARRRFSPDEVVHAGQGFYMLGSSKSTYGAYANHTMYPDLREPGSPNSAGFLYAPTMFGPGADCIEAVTVFQNALPQVWAWDWCAASPAPFRVLDVTPRFVKRYVRTMKDGLPEFTVETVLAADGVTWDMALYDYAASQWHVIYQTSGNRNGNYGLGQSGWDFFETYTNILPNGKSDVCRSFGGKPIAADGISIATEVAGGAFVPLTPSNAQPLQFDSFHCAKFAFSVPTPDDFWEMSYK